MMVLVALAFTTSAFAGCLGNDTVQPVLPVAVVTVTPIEKDDGVTDTFEFDASASTGTGLRYEWSFGDGTQADRPVVTHTYAHGTGTYPVRLLITDLHGTSDLWSDSIIVGTGENRPPVALFTPSSRYLNIGEPFTVDARASHDPDGDTIVYEWDFNHPMDLEGYYHFRENKHRGGAPEKKDDATVTTGNKSSLPGPLGSIIEDLKRLTDKHAPEPGSEPRQSLFDGRRSSTGPVFTLQEGFPEATWFYVKLRVIDTKGASAAYISEEIWPVEVVASKLPSHYEGETSGTFTLGGPASLTDALPNEPPVETDKVWVFEIPAELADLGRNETDAPIHSLWVNVTWTQNIVHELTGGLPDIIHVEIVPPEGAPRRIDDDRTAITSGFTGGGGHGEGEWTVYLYARQGIDIDYTVTYWAMIEQNPFRDLEAPFV